MLRPPAVLPARKLSRNQRRLNKKQSQSSARLNIVSPQVVQALQAAERADKSGQTEKAIELYSKLYHTYPDIGVVQYRTAVFFDDHQRSSTAYSGFKTAVKLAPANAEFWQGFGAHLIRTGEKEAAVKAYQRVCILRRDDVDLILALANAHMVNDDPSSALSTTERALALRFDYALTHFKRGIYLSALGRFEESHEAFFQALELDPDMYAAYYHLAHSGLKPGTTENLVADLKKKIPSMEPGSHEFSLLLFAIAKFEEESKNYNEAFTFYLQANEQVFDPTHLNLDFVSEVFDRCRQAYSSQTFEIMSAAGVDAQVPVFIIGMPRSGTTLTEQVIASHSQANGAGELVKMSTLTQVLANASDRNRIFPLNIETLNPIELRKSGEKYLDYLHTQSPGKWRRITDKMPFNFENLGLIKILFPKAAIIHCKRNPLDTCMSCFVTHFGHPEKMAFAYNLEALGRFYREYKKLMAHWYQVLPGQILDVNYEDMIENPEAISRKIIDHIGLEWEPECLEFYKSKRDVKTASLWQVRQPIYKTSAGRWKRYEKHLAPLQKALIST